MSTSVAFDAFSAPAGTGAVTHSAAAVLCAHCTLPVGATVYTYSDAGLQFCCQGCATVHGLLHAHGLDHYYALPQRREAPKQSSGRTYEEFDHAAFQTLYVREGSDGLRHTELYLEGVHCASCVWLVERVPLLLPGVARAELNIRRSLATIEWDPHTASLSAIARTLDSLGYQSHPFRGVSRDTIRQRESRAMLARIGVAGAIAINVMLATLALYSGDAHGMEQSSQQLFRWVSLLLTTATLIWPGRVFFTGAWSAWRTRTLHMDVPIAIALMAGLARGMANTINNSGPVYFDGLAILVFALLVGRFLQLRGQRLAADSAELLHALAPDSAHLVEGDTLREVPTAALLPGMIIEVRAGEGVAADGVVVRGTSSINAALLTGESKPVAVAPGETVFAGTQNIDAAVRVRVEAAGESSRIAQIMLEVESSAQRRAPVVLLANRLAGIFVAVVLAAAVLTFVIKSRSAQHALDDAIALLIVTCPCALALATPLAITVSIGRAARRGILVKGGDAVELLAHPGTLVLDKTGTLTEGHTTLVEWKGPSWVQPLVHALEVGSSHPLAGGFRRAWGGNTTLEVSDAINVPGCGIAGTVEGKRVQIGSPRWIAATGCLDALGEVAPHIAPAGASLTPVLVAVDGSVVAYATLGDRIRTDALQSLRALRQKGWKTVMLSGDHPTVAAAVGEALEFDAGDVHGDQTPEAKLGYVERRTHAGERIVMVGDGVNDAPAIAAASVGIGVHGGAEACLANADVYLTTPGLSPLVELIAGAERTTLVIKRNIAFSVFYNLIGGGMAIAGLLTPLIAAVLMPTSSITVIAGSWWSRTFPRIRESHV